MRVLGGLRVPLRGEEGLCELSLFPRKYISNSSIPRTRRTNADLQGGEVERLLADVVALEGRDEVVDGKAHCVCVAEAVESEGLHIDDIKTGNTSSERLGPTGWLLCSAFADVSGRGRHCASGAPALQPLRLFRVSSAQHLGLLLQLQRALTSCHG